MPAQATLDTHARTPSRDADEAHIGTHAAPEHGFWSWVKRQWYARFAPETLETGLDDDAAIAFMDKYGEDNAKAISEAASGLLNERMSGKGH